LAFAFVFSFGRSQQPSKRIPAKVSVIIKNKERQNTGVLHFVQDDDGDGEEK